MGIVDWKENRTQKWKGLYFYKLSPNYSVMKILDKDLLTYLAEPKVSNSQATEIDWTDF